MSELRIIAIDEWDGQRRDARITESCPARQCDHCRTIFCAITAGPHCGTCAEQAAANRAFMALPRFNGTIEFLVGQPAAVVTLTDERGEWVGSCRVELPRGVASGDLYEMGRAHAWEIVEVKGGRLETFKVVS